MTHHSNTLGFGIEFGLLFINEAHLLIHELHAHKQFFFTHIAFDDY